MILKIDGFKFFLDKRNYTKKNRHDYLTSVAKVNPEKYKQIISDEIIDECHVYFTWYKILLWLTPVLIVLSFVFNVIWYVFLLLSILSILGSKVFKNNLESLRLGYNIFMLLADMFVSDLKSKEEQKNK